MNSHSLCHAMLAVLGLVSAEAGANSYTIVDLGGYMEPSRINKHGNIAGSDYSAHAYIYRGDHWHKLKCANSAQAFAINARGDAVGYSGESPMLWRREGGCTILPMPPGASSGFARGIAADGTAAGDFFVPGNSINSHCFIDRPDGTSEELGFIGRGANCDVQGINRDGQVVGGVDTTRSGDGRAFIWQAGHFRNLGVLPGGTISGANAINDKGHVVGAVFMSDSTLRAFLWTPGGMKDLSDPKKYLTTDAHDINDHGEIVGHGWRGYGKTEALRFEGGAVIPLESEVSDLGDWKLTVALGINDSGIIVGVGRLGGKDHGFMLVPQLNR